MSSKAKLHARRRAQRFGDLDQLLAEALKDQRKGEGAVKRLKGVNQAIHEQFSNPANWTALGVVLVMYVDELTGEQQTVGLFQDLRHKSGARKLTRVAMADLAMGFNQEITHDPFLVKQPEPICPPAAPANPYERQAIRDYVTRVTTQQQSLAEFTGSKLDAAALLRELKQMGVERIH